MQQGNHRSCRVADLHISCQRKGMSSALTATIYIGSRAGVNYFVNKLILRSDFENKDGYVESNKINKELHSLIRSLSWRGWSSCFYLQFFLVLNCVCRCAADIYFCMYNEQTDSHLIDSLLYCSTFTAPTCSNANASSSGSSYSLPAKLHKRVHAGPS
jgi:hypothetical protein